MLFASAPATAVLRGGRETRIVQFPGGSLRTDHGSVSRRDPAACIASLLLGAFARDALARGAGPVDAGAGEQGRQGRRRDIQGRRCWRFRALLLRAPSEAPDGSEVSASPSRSPSPRTNARVPAVFFAPVSSASRRTSGTRLSSSMPMATSGLVAAIMLAENPTDHQRSSSAFTGERSLKSNSSGISAPLPREALDILTPHAAFQPLPARKARLAALLRRLRRHGARISPGFTGSRPATSTRCRSARGSWRVRRRHGLLVAFSRRGRGEDRCVGFMGRRMGEGSSLALPALVSVLPDFVLFFSVALGLVAIYLLV